MPRRLHTTLRRPSLAVTRYAAARTRSACRNALLAAFLCGACSFFACAAPLAAAVDVGDTGANTSTLTPSTLSPSPPPATPVPTPMASPPSPTTMTGSPPPTATTAPLPSTRTPLSAPPATPSTERPTLVPTTTTQTPTLAPATQPPPSSSSPPSVSTSATPSTPPNSAPATQPPTSTAPPAQSPQTALPSGTEPPSSEETVVAYNSTTLPPGVDANVLDGGELVSVETKATTRGGQTSVSYTIVVKKGDQIETVRQPAFNTTDPALSTVPPSLATAGPSASTEELPSQPQQQQPHATSRSAMMNSGAIAGLALGALFVGVLISGVLMRRRNKKHAAAADKEPKSAEESYAALEAGAHKDSRETMNRTRNSSYDFEFASSISGGAGASRTSGRRRQGSLWEDAAIVAARIPFEKVEVGQLISRGGFGEVYRGVYREQVVAIKRLLPETRKDLSHIESFLSEIKLQAALDHPHIVAFLGVAWESLSELYAISEFMDRGDLRSLLLSYHHSQQQQLGSTRPPPPRGFNAEKVRIALHVAHALTYLHSLQPQVLHRDLKSRNILLSATLEAKLTDFGSSRVRADSQATMTAGVGSALWMAPEVMVGERYDAKSDIFSLGVVLSELDTHELPYASARGDSGSSTSSSTNSMSGARSLPETAILQLVSIGRLQVTFSRACQPDMEALARRCIRVDPRERPTAAEVLYQLHVALRGLETL